MIQKIVKMSMSEYDNMMETIKKQDEVIKGFLNADNVVIVDQRHHWCRIENYIVPKITANNIDLANKFMKEEFDIAQRKLNDSISLIQEVSKERDILKEENCYLKKPWWAKL